MCRKRLLDTEVFLIIYSWTFPVEKRANFSSREEYPPPNHSSKSTYEKLFPAVSRQYCSPGLFWCFNLELRGIFLKNRNFKFQISNFSKLLPAILIIYFNYCVIKFWYSIANVPKLVLTFQYRKIAFKPS